MARILVVNRGEIAIRVLNAIRDLGLYAIGVYAGEDKAHNVFANESVELSSDAAFMSIDELVKVAQQNNVDMVHPAYGFLSESFEFAKALRSNGIEFIGPSEHVLDICGHKEKARNEATLAKVPVLKASGICKSVDDAARFSNEVSYPIFLKAVDGGGGRGTTLVSSHTELDSAFRKCIAESPSHTIFAEQAAIDGYQHIEVQIIGDLKGHIVSLGDRECSMQRKYQKVVEISPSRVNSELQNKLVGYAINLAQRLKYSSLGTFEFLVRERDSSVFFLEVNPRLQVEHTVTEQVLGFDIVQAQILISLGNTLSDLNLDRPLAPRGTAIQLRITAENPSKNFALSTGKITKVYFPGGNGIRVDSHIGILDETIITPNYDSLLAKLIIWDRNFIGAIHKAKRALQDTIIEGIDTNVSLLFGILSIDAFAKNSYDTTTLGKSLQEIISLGVSIQNNNKSSAKDFIHNAASDSSNLMSSGTVMFRKNDSWRINTKNKSSSNAHILSIDKIIKNDFPQSMTTEVSLDNQAMTLEIASLSKQEVNAFNNEKGDVSNSRHIISPFTGTMTEFLVDEGDDVTKDEPLCIIKQMKMELEVRAPFNGRISRIADLEEGAAVAEGDLLFVYE